MRVHPRFGLTGIILLLQFFGFIGVYAEDFRTSYIDAYLLIDTSSAMKDHRKAAIDWTFQKVIHGLLREGDRVTLWMVQETPQILYQGTIQKDQSWEEVKATLMATPPGEKPAAYRKALQEVTQTEAARENREPLPLVLLISGIALGGPGMEETAELLRTSRVEDHPGWKSIVIGLGLEEQITKSAVAYMKKRGY